MNLSAPPHSCTLYDFDMNPRHSGGEDLFEVICSGERFVVDSNCEWKDRALNEPKVAFILGRTLGNERDNLQGELFNDKVRDGRRNVFIFTGDELGIGKLVVHRLDIGFRALLKEEIPWLSGPDATDPSRWNCPQKRLELIQQIDRLMKLSIEELRRDVTAGAPACFGRYALSCSIAEKCYALILLEGGRGVAKEKQKLRDNHENSFGDTTLIRDALLFRAAILTEDELAKRMAFYCSILCRPNR